MKSVYSNIKLTLFKALPVRHTVLFFSHGTHYDYRHSQGFMGGASYTFAPNILLITRILEFCWLFTMDFSDLYIVLLSVTVVCFPSLS